MISVSVPFGSQDPMDFNDNTAADRVGRRIREIRESYGMTQAQLGARVGLSADRVQKYENGARKPKPELLKNFARSLGVSSLALTDPVVGNYFGAMYAFFEMEKMYDLKVVRDGDNLSLVFEDGYRGSMNSYLREWEEECRRIEVELEATTSEEERAEVLQSYKLWKWNFPYSMDISQKDLKALKKAKLEEQLKQLQKELSDLDNEGG